jgi:hypothetical protein
MVSLAKYLGRTITFWSEMQVDIKLNDQNSFVSPKIGRQNEDQGCYQADRSRWLALDKDKRKPSAFQTSFQNWTGNDCGSAGFRPSSQDPQKYIKAGGHIGDC